MMANMVQFSLMVLSLTAAQAVFTYSPQECINCHKRGATASTLQISIDEFKASIHGEEITCQECHTLVENENHRTAPGSGVVDCRSCHEQQNRHGWKSERGTRPQCYSCHTRHTIFAKDDPRSSVNARRLNETCQSCHARECGRPDYLSWLPSLQIASHSKQDFSRLYEKSNCMGCHQGKAAHGEQAPINDQTCFTCHVTRDGRSKLLGYFHTKADARRQPGVMAAASIYQVIIVVLILGGAAFYIRKLTKG